MDQARWLCRCKLALTSVHLSKGDLEMLSERFHIAGHLRGEDKEGRLVWCCPHSGWCEYHQTPDSGQCFPPDEEATLDEALDFLFRRIRKIEIMPLDSKHEDVVWKPAGPYWFYPLASIKEVSGQEIVPHFIALQVPDPAQYDKLPAGIVLTHEGGQGCLCEWTPETRQTLKGPTTYAVVRSRLSELTPELEKHARSLLESLFIHWIKGPWISTE